MLFFDIETTVHEQAENWVSPKPAPKNYRDESKIADYQANSVAEQLERAALDADLGAIRCISYGKYPDVGDVPVVKVDIDMPEEDMLKAFWLSFNIHAGRVCGYNIIGFDLPYIMRRSMDLNIPVGGLRPSLARYRTEPTRDLMAILYNWGPAKPLKWVAKRYGIPNPLPELDGSKVAEMDNQTLAQYAENDVRIVMHLHERMQGVYF